jgi:hypothetical protein
VAAFAGETAANANAALAQCDGFATERGSDQAAGCFDSDRLLGPSKLPTTGPPGSVDADVGKMTRGYHRFGSTTKAAFLDLYYVTGKGWKYPPDGGFAIDPKTQQPIYKIVRLKPGKDGKPVFVDRFGPDTGSFLAPADTSYAKRALPPDSLDTFGAPPYNYNLYEVLKPFRVESGRIAPWFGQTGGGWQYMTCVAADFKCPKSEDPKLRSTREGQGPTPVSGTSPETSGPFGAANIARSINPTAFSHQLVPDLGTLWAETEVSSPVAGTPRLHRASHIDNVLSIGACKRLAPVKLQPN